MRFVLGFYPTLIYSEKVVGPFHQSLHVLLSHKRFFCMTQRIIVFPILEGIMPRKRKGEKYLLEKRRGKERCPPEVEFAKGELEVPS